MRLLDRERQIIREAVTEIYGPAAVVRLFGSRVHDHLRGGDIDLHIQAAEPDVVRIGRGGLRVRRSDRLWLLLQRRLGEQKIDIVDITPDAPSRSIDEAAYADGVPL